MMSDEELVIEETLNQALRNGDIAVVKRWIDLLPQRHLINRYKTEKCMTALHVACIHNRLEVVKSLLNSGANPKLGDYIGRTALHCACISDSKGLKELVEELVRRGRIDDVNVVDDENCTPLHYAAGKGHSTVVQLLLDKGAKLNAIDSADNTPVHKAAEEGHTSTLEVMISYVPECVHYKGEDNDTPLHCAASNNHREAAVTLLGNGADARAKNKDDVTPLHECVTNPGLQLAKILLDKGAEIDVLDHNNHTPLCKACLFDNIEAVGFLLKHGAVPKAKCLEVALTKHHKRIVVELLKCPQWPQLLRHTFEVDKTTTTPFRMIITTMPDIAEDILNKCTVTAADSNLEVAFNYEFIEDFVDNEKNHDASIEDVDRGRLQSQKSSMAEKCTYGVSFLELSSRQQNGYTTNWGPVGFTKSNHPLAIMVKSDGLKLLTHPLIGSLLHHKWIKFGQYSHYLTLGSFCLFLVFLIMFTFLVPNPQTTKCTAISQGNETAASNTPCDTSVVAQVWIYISAILVIVYSLCRLVWEVVVLFFSLGRLGYFSKWFKYVEMTLFLCSIIFVWVFNTPCLCVYNWQWQIGIAAMFLAWFCLVAYFSKFPLTGVYLVMFFTVLNSFKNTIVLLLLLLMAFAVTFYMAFQEPTIIRSPFSSFGRSLVKTWTMTSGDLGFDSIFRLDPTGNGDTLEEPPFPSISYILWVVFVVFMPILLSNLLTGLAVDDVKEIRNQAELRKLALQVEIVLTTETFLPVKIRRWFVPGAKCVELDKKTKFYQKLQFVIWGGQRYDTTKSLNVALHQDQKRESHSRSSVTLNDLREEMNTMKERNEEAQVNMKKQMDSLNSKMELVLQKIAEIKGK